MFSICSRMDFKNKMSNVAFGGNWSEELVTLQELRLVLEDLDWAVENCTEQDVTTEAVLASLLYVRKNIEKGPMHVEAFLRATRIEIATIRQVDLKKSVDRIKLWSGV